MEAPMKFDLERAASLPRRQSFRRRSWADERASARHPRWQADSLRHDGV